MNYLNYYEYSEKIGVASSLVSCLKLRVEEAINSHKYDARLNRIFFNLYRVKLEMDCVLALYTTRVNPEFYDDYMKSLPHKSNERK